MSRKTLSRFIKLFAAVTLILAQVHSTDVSVPSIQAAEKSKIAINYDSIAITTNQSFRLTITGTKSKVTWKSTYPLVASVSSNGVVTGKVFGKTTIIATIANRSYHCKVTVSYIDNVEPYKHWDHYGADYMSDFALSVLDMKSTFDDFKSVGYKATGVYAAVSSEKAIYLEGIDKNGKSLGIVKNKDLSYVQFGNAVKLRIMNPDRVQYTIDFLPVKPTVIKEKGFYTYDDFTWYKLKDGNIQAPVIIAMKNSYVDYITDAEKTGNLGLGNLGSFSRTPHDTGKIADPEMMDAWLNGNFSAEAIKKESGELKSFKIYVDQYKVYIDEKDVFAYGKVGMDFPDDFKETIIAYRDLVKGIAGKKYLPDQSALNKPLRIRYTYELRPYSEKNCICMNKEDIPSTYFHEMTHYYQRATMDYGCQISAWMEGISQVLAEDALSEMGADTTPITALVQNMNPISEQDRKDFESYFLNVGNIDSYSVGYNFIRFIQKEYGDNVVYLINKDIMKNKQYPVCDYISPSNRTEKADKMFIKAIKDATSKDVFTRFADEVVKSK